MKRILLVLPSTTYRTAAFMTAASKLNAELIVASDHRQAMASLVPDTTIALNFYKPESIKEKLIGVHRRRSFDAVVGVDDTSAYIAALAAEALSLPHNPVEAVKAARNKYRMREKLAAGGLRSPGFQLYPVKKNPSHFAKRADYPCVLKPIFLSASRGVTRADTPEQFITAFGNIQEILSDKDVIQKTFGDEAEHILIEDYIPGIEVALEGILVNGEFRTLALFDKPDPLEGPYFVETIYVTPSRLPGYVQREVTHETQRAAHALGLRNGPVHAELRINEKGVWVIEIAARSIGGLCSRILRFNNGATLEEIILRQAVGEDVRGIQRERQAAGVMMLPAPMPGILQDVRGVEAAKAVPGIEDVVITIPRGQSLMPMPRGGRYLGFIFARGILPEEVEASIRKAYQQLDIDIRD